MTTKSSEHQESDVRQMSGFAPAHSATRTRAFFRGRPVAGSARSRQRSRCRKRARPPRLGSRHRCPARPTRPAGRIRRLSTTTAPPAAKGAGQRRRCGRLPGHCRGRSRLGRARRNPALMAAGQHCGREPLAGPTSIHSGSGAQARASGISLQGLERGTWPSITLYQLYGPVRRQPDQDHEKSVWSDGRSCSPTPRSPTPTFSEWG